jgi:REP element-mobilizing transposase RayT
MPNRGSVFAQGLYYHIYNRGAGKQAIFFNDGNYVYLLGLIKRYLKKYGATIIAYCLMPNHYHFLLRQDSEVPLSKFINVVFNAYVQAVNLQQSRTGTLFEGRFQHAWIDRDDYLIHLCRYIHNNPRKAGLVAQLENWPFSNYPDWIGSREGKLKDDVFIHDNFPGGAEEYVAFVDDLQEEERVSKYVAKYVWD